MGIRDETTFSDGEMIAAFTLLLPAEAAREHASGLNSLPDLHFEGRITGEDLQSAPAAGPRSYDDDILDLLSMVSNDVALRAWQLLGVSVEEGQRRRELFRLRMEPVLLRDPRSEW